MWNIMATTKLLLQLVLGLASVLSPTMGTQQSQQVICYNMNHGSLVGESAVVRCPVPPSNIAAEGRQRDEQPSWSVSSAAEQTSRSVLPGDSRFIVARGALWLQNTTMEDAGNYTCTRGNDSACMRLWVWPRDGHICHNHNLHFHAKGTYNQSVRLICPYVDADLPIKKVLWYKECKQLIQAKNSTIFRIPNMQQENVGNYTCVVSTWVSNTKYEFSHTWSLSIRDRVIVNLPVMIYPQGNATRAVVLGKQLRLGCQARYTLAGPLKPLVWWLVDGKFSTDSHIPGITEDSEITIVNETGVYETVEHGLNIIRVEMIHLGVNFTCIALNGRGFTYGSLSLYEACLTPPTIST
uniref:interleukin-1 receptor accessory protein-like 1-A n=1 Tax=Myxine glutinosa TaxID=7769 RepID=UPI00358EBF7D